MPTNANLHLWQQLPGLFDAIVFAATELSNSDSTVRYPENDNVFRAFKECAPEDVRVVILGQDPYHDGSATGLCFHSNRLRNPPSLANIQQKLLEETGKKGDLESWPEQGVLMLNTSLTVEKGKPGSHKKIWKPFTTEVIKYLNTRDNIIWIVWGRHAYDIVRNNVTNASHKIEISSHPSPLSYTKTMGNFPSFKEAKIFNVVNEILEKQKQTPIKWSTQI